MFFCQRSKRESLRPVSELQTLFTRNCWLQTDSFLLLMKMASDEDERPSDSFCERYRHSNFLYSKNDQYKIIDLHFFEKHAGKYPLIDLLRFDCRKVICMTISRVIVIRACVTFTSKLLLRL